MLVCSMINMQKAPKGIISGIERIVHDISTLYYKRTTSKGPNSTTSLVLKMRSTEEKNPSGTDKQQWFSQTAQ